MAILKSSQRALRKSERQRAYNLEWKNKVKKAWKSFFLLIKEKKIEDAKKSLPFVQKLIDKARKEGIFKKNKASRLKSKIFKALNAIEKEKKTHFR